MPVANTFSSALELIGRNSYGSTKLLEVNADGSIRTQTWKEKLGNFRARITRSYDLRKDSKDAAVAHALERLANAAITSDNPHIRAEVETFNRFTPDFIARYREAKTRVEQRDTPRHATIAAAPVNPADQAAVASLHQQGATNAPLNTAPPAPNYGATAQAAQTTTPAATPAAVPAGTAPVDLTALANKYQVELRVAKYLVNGGPEFGRVIRTILSEPKTKGVQWDAPIDQRYATRLNTTYRQELAYAVAAGRNISEQQIFDWAVAALKQVQN
jgi:hypothetical protein